jgi:hypothetical protein
LLLEFVGRLLWLSLSVVTGQPATHSSPVITDPEAYSVYAAVAAIRIRESMREERAAVPKSAEKVCL